jgi:hypothetical protein
MLHRSEDQTWPWECPPWNIHNSLSRPANFQNLQPREKVPPNQVKVKLSICIRFFLRCILAYMPSEENKQKWPISNEPV